MKKLIILVSFILFLFLTPKVFATEIRELGNDGVTITLTDGTNEWKRIRDSYYVVSDEGSYFVNTTKIITDDGRFNNRADVVRIQKMYNNTFDFDTLKSDGYKTIVILLRLEAWEIDDGLQYIFIYDDLEDDSWLHGGKFNHNPAKADNTHVTYTFYIELDISSITNDDFVIRYDASGKNNDDWANNNVRYQLGFSKEERKTSNIWYTVNNDYDNIINWYPMDIKK